ncbi:MAG: C-terminal binding protein [Armatimonadetes bacterium]|nr:C-terminal binding protein [Armatimonadota bacterium]
MKLVITDWEDLGTAEPARKILEPAGFEVAFGECRSVADVIAAADGADALMVRAAPMPRAVFEALDGLRFVSRMGIGPWDVDLAAAVEHRVAVAHCPKYCTDEAVAHTLALVLALNRRLDEAREAARAGLWRTYGDVGPVFALSDLNLGLVGLGRMGERVAVAADALGFAVLGYDPHVRHAPEVVEMVSFEAVLAESDILCLLCPATPETHHLINAAALEQMKATAYLVNTARGALVDEAALLEALDSGRLAGAALDVLEHEPPATDHPLLHHPQVWVTPHVGYHSETSQHELKVHAARNVVHCFTGERVAGLLTPDFRRV